MTAMLATLEKPLREAFEFYAAQRDGEGALLSVEGFVAMLEELQLMGSAFSVSTVKSIFRRAQYQTATDESLVHSISAELMRFEPFVESLVVCALYKKPDPYLALNTRVEEFLVHSVINPLFHKKRISTQIKSAFTFLGRKASMNSSSKKERRQSTGGKKKKTKRKRTGNFHPSNP